MDPKKKKSTERKFKGKKPRVAAERVKDSEFDLHKEDYRKGKNDPIWRTKDAVMTKLVANLAFGLPAGLQQEVSVTPLAVTTKPLGQPGVLAIRTYVTGGNSADYNSPLNLAVRKIYSFVRHANSGSKNYEASDMGMYFISIGQALALLGFLQRALRVAHEYSATNRYKPKALMSANAILFDSVIAEYARLKYLIAWLGRILGGLAYPDMPYFRACYEAFKYIYTDNDSPKEQFYILTPASIGVYKPTYDSNGGGVDYIANAFPNLYSPNNYYDIATLEAMVKSVTDVLLGDEDIGIISGDIQKAFSKAENKLFKPEAWGEDYEVYLHSPEFLQQVHNLTTLPKAGISIAGYKQNPGNPNTAPFIVFDAGASTGLSSSYSVAHNTIIDAFSREPSPEEVVNCMVLNPQFKVKSMGGTPETFGVDPSSLAFDLFLPQTVNFIRGVSMYDIFRDLNNVMFDKTQEIQQTIPGNAIEELSHISKFDWHPISWKATYNGSNIFELLPQGDFQNFRVFTYEVGYRIHENSMLNLLDFSEINFY